MKLTRIIAIVAVVLLSTVASAAAPESPLSEHNRSLYNGIGKILLRSAELMPEERYAFRPADDVRTFGQIVGHVADSQYGFCSAVLGEKNPAPRVEKTKTSKADLVVALREAVTYCGRAYDAMTDASAAEAVEFMGGPKPKLGVLNINNVHTIEHYGNLVTYMRMNEVVPPTSDPEFMKELSK